MLGGARRRRRLRGTVTVGVGDLVHVHEGGEEVVLGAYLVQAAPTPLPRSSEKRNATSDLARRWWAARGGEGSSRLTTVFLLPKKGGGGGSSSSSQWKVEATCDRRFFRTRRSLLLAMRTDCPF
jgi:hypothetical protein